MRAELKSGQLLKEMREKGERASGKLDSAGPGRGKKNGVVLLDSVLPTLSELGVTKQESSNWQLLAEACSGDNPVSADYRWETPPLGQRVLFGIVNFRSPI